MIRVNRSKIEWMLQRLGLTANYTGFFYLVYAIQICLKDTSRLRAVTKSVYPDVAKQYDTTWTAVERNIRTAGAVIWRENRELLCELAQRELKRQPSSSQLLAILTFGLRQRTNEL